MNLTDRFCLSQKLVPATGRRDYQDALVPGLSLRVTATGHRSFVLIARYPAKPKNPTRRALGDYGELTLEQAREKARGWLLLVEKGIDPAVEAARVRAEVARLRINTFAAVAESFLSRYAPTLAKEAEANRIIRGEFVAAWGDRPANDIRPEEVAAAIRAIVDRGAPYQAHNSFAHLRRLYNWAIGTHEFGITASPVERLSPRDLIGAREARERILSDAELRAVWSAADSMGYPYGPLIQLLILSGQREREIADLAWPEVELDKSLLTIPAERMKGGRTHELPLAGTALALLSDLPRFGDGPFAFTTTAGAKPVNGFSKAKVRIDRLSGVTGWRFHDLRRTVRTHLSALPVQDIVRELVIAHAKPTLHRVYDRHSYQAEKLECLTLWEARLAGILQAS